VLLDHLVGAGRHVDASAFAALSYVVAQSLPE
jgi:hypothetical protein